MMTNDFRMGFFGRRHCNQDAKKNFQEKWSKMTDQEKLDFMNEKVECMGRDPFSIEAIDARCENWLSKTQEEKQAIIDERKETLRNRHARHKRGRCNF